MLNTQYFEAGILYENSGKGWKRILLLLIRLGKHKLLPKKAGFFKHNVCGHPVCFFCGKCNVWLWL